MLKTYSKLSLLLSSNLYLTCEFLEGFHGNGAYCHYPTPWCCFPASTASINRNLPLSFHDLWSLNRIQNPARLLRNANDLRIPAHNFATLKRLPLFTFPRTWNEDDEARKRIPSLKIYKKQTKTALLASIVV